MLSSCVLRQVLVVVTIALILGSQLDDLRAFIKSQPKTAAVAVGYLRNSVVQIVQDFSRDHAATARSVRIPLGSAGAMDSPYLSVQDLIKRWPQGTARDAGVGVNGCGVKRCPYELGQASRTL